MPQGNGKVNKLITRHPGFSFLCLRSTICVSAWYRYDVIERADLRGGLVYGHDNGLVLLGGQLAPQELQQTESRGGVQSRRRLLGTTTTWGDHFLSKGSR